MEVSALEAEAKAKAVKHVANILHAPDKLEKVSNYREERRPLRIRPSPRLTLR